MQRISITVVLLLGLGVTFLGCNGGKNIIQGKAISERNDIFTEIQTENIPAKGFSDLLIRAQIKTHVEGYYFLEFEGVLSWKAQVSIYV